MVEDSISVPERYSGDLRLGRGVRGEKAKVPAMRETKSSDNKLAPHAFHAVEFLRLKPDETCELFVTHRELLELHFAGRRAHRSQLRNWRECALR